MSNRHNGFMLIEVLIALSLFGLSAVYLVEGAFVASRTIRFMKDAENSSKICCGREMKYSKKKITRSFQREVTFPP